MDGWCIDRNPAYKLFIQDLVSCKNESNGWSIDFGKNTSPKRLIQFQIQAKILQMTGFNNDIMIVDDGTGKAKATRGSTVPGDFSWLQIGADCSIVATLTDSGKLPHIDIIKMTKIENPLLTECWPLEVKELRNYLSKDILPILEASTTS